MTRDRFPAGVLALGLCCSALSSPAQINSWTNGSSAAWESASWSLGVLPGTNQSIFITNAGWKAVGINPATVQHFPQTLSIASLTISSPTNSFNTLLLNFAGTGSPLVIGNGTNPGQVVVASNSAVGIFSSALQLNNAGINSNGAFSVGGTFTESEASHVTASMLTVGDIGPGIFNLTNSLLQVNTQTVAGAGHFAQDGGTNSTTTLQIGSGRYDLYHGQVSGTIAFIGTGAFVQHGGTVNSDVHPDNGGTYEQDGGILNGPISMVWPVGSGIGRYTLNDGVHTGGMTVPGGELEAGFVLQNGGTNNGDLTLGYFGGLASGLIGPGSYTLSNGVLQSATIHIAGVSSLAQSGGTALIGALNIDGTQDRHGDFANGTLTLNGGLLSVQTLSLQAATVQQSGGTNEITSGATMGFASPTYSLSGGALSGTSFNISGSPAGNFSQNGGVHTENYLGLSGSSLNPAIYNFSGGQLSVSNLEISGGVFHHTGGMMTRPAFLILTGSIWDEKTNGAQFGQLQLKAGFNSTNSSLRLPANACVVRFANSSGVVWSNTATLTIEGWNGSVSGGGVHQIFFGSDSSGLNGAQLTQVWFRNPAGTAGTYPAALLPTGEIVPAGWLVLTQSGGDFVLKWNGNFTLQTSMNVAGPYQDVTNAANFYTKPAVDPQRFFRLRP